ncbi:MAG: glycosyltransferase family 4 protein, partial [Planctomycetes bacterium]|nr:glycosyltransferase family 4 protein [Planctomycetota bacterium]
GPYLVDTLYLDVVPRVSLRGVDAHLIVHHLESLHPGPSRTSDEVFRAREESLLRPFRGFLATSEFTRDYLVQRGFAAESVVVLRPGVEGFAPASPRSTGALRVLMVANLIERKGVLPFLSELIRVLRPTDAFSLRIVGSPDFEPGYAARCHAIVAAAPELEGRVELCGALPHGAMPGEYQRADLLVSAATMETFGMALQEACAAGLPVLAVEGGYAVHHAQHGSTGLHFAGCGALADGLRRLLDDPAQLANLQAGARAAAPGSARSWGVVAQEFLAAFSRG